MKVLLVDDSLHILSRMKEMLFEIACITKLSSATNAFDALEMIQTDTPHLALLDINMPGKTGVELLKEIKQFYPSIKVMMVTNQSVDYYKPICKQMGAEYFIDKSTEFQAIPKLIEELCQQFTD